MEIRNKRKEVIKMIEIMLIIGKNRAEEMRRRK